MSVKFATFRTDRLYYYNGTSWVDMAGAAETPNLRGSGWTTPFWKIQSGKLLYSYASQTVDNPGGSTDIRQRNSTNGGSTWSFKRITNTNVDSNDRIFPPAISYDITNDRMLATWILFNAQSSGERRTIRTTLIKPSDDTQIFLEKTLTSSDNVGFYGSSSTSPDTNHELNIQGGAFRFSDNVLSLYEDDDGKIKFRSYPTVNSSTVLANTPVSLYTTSVETGGGTIFHLEDTLTEGSTTYYYTVGLYLTKKESGGELHAILMKDDLQTSSTSSIVSDIQIFSSLNFDFIPNGTNLLGGIISAFFDKDAKIVHVWARNVDSSGDNSVYYMQIDVDIATNGETSQFSTENKIISLSSSAVNYGIHGGAQDGSIYILLHDGANNTIYVYKKSTNSTWLLSETILTTGLSTYGIAHLLTDYNTATGDTFDSGATSPSPSPQVLASSGDSYTYNKLLNRYENVSSANKHFSKGDLVEIEVGYEDGDTTKFIKNFIGHISDFTVIRNVDGRDVLKVSCDGFERYLKDAINLNYPDKFDYWVAEFAGNDFSDNSPDGLDFPATFDAWPMNKAFKALLTRAFIDPTLFTRRRKHLDRSDAQIDGTFLIEDAPVSVILERNRNYGNPNLAVIVQSPDQDNIILQVEDDEYILKTKFGQSLFDYINEIVEPYGWDWGSSSYDDGAFFLRPRNNPTRIITTNELTKSGTWTEGTDLDAVSGVYIYSSTVNDYVESTFKGERLDIVLALANLNAGVQAKVASGISKNQLRLDDMTGTFSVGNRIIFDMPDLTYQNSTISSIVSGNTITLSNPLTEILPSGSIVRTATARCQVKTGTDFSTGTTVSDVYLPSYYPHGLDHFIQVFKGYTTLGGLEKDDRIVSGSIRFFYHGLDQESGINPTVFNVASGLAYDDYVVRVTRISDTEAIASSVIYINSLLVYENDITFPKAFYYTGDNTVSGTVVRLSAFDEIADMRNDVTVVGRRIGVEVPGGVDKPLNPNNPISKFFISRAVDINSIQNTEARNFIGRPLQTVLIEPSISSQDRADYWSVQFMNRFRFPGRRAEFAAVGNPLIEIGDPILLIDENTGIMDKENKLWIDGIRRQINGDRIIDTYNTTNYMPWESFTPKMPVDITKFGNEYITNVEITPITSVNDPYDPYRSDEDGTLIKIKFDLVRDAYIRIQILSESGIVVADLLNTEDSDKTKGWIFETAGSNKLVTWDGVDQYGNWNKGLVRSNLEEATAGFYVAESKNLRDATGVPLGAAGKFFVRFIVVDSEGKKRIIDTKDSASPNDFIYTKRGDQVTGTFQLSHTFSKGSEFTPPSGITDDDDFKFIINSTRPSRLRINVNWMIYGLISDNFNIFVADPTPMQTVKIEKQDFVTYNNYEISFKPQNNMGMGWGDFNRIFETVGSNAIPSIQLSSADYNRFIAWYFLFEVFLTDKSGRSVRLAQDMVWEGPNNASPSWARYGVGDPVIVAMPPGGTPAFNLGIAWVKKIE